MPQLEKKKPDALRDAPSPSLGGMGLIPFPSSSNSRTFKFPDKGAISRCIMNGPQQNFLAWSRIEGALRRLAPPIPKQLWSSPSRPVASLQDRALNSSAEKIAERGMLREAADFVEKGAVSFVWLEPRVVTSRSFACGRTYLPSLGRISRGRRRSGLVNLRSSFGQRLELCSFLIATHGDYAPTATRRLFTRQSWDIRRRPLARNVEPLFGVQQN
jgi:hypothetical protein